MQRYLIAETSDAGSYERSDNYLCHITIRDALTRATSTPSSVLITIRNPCGTALVTNQAMTSAGSGVYSYDYTIPAAAVYGRYEVEISTATYTQRYITDFYVFPWDANNQVRRISGVGQNKSISDADLNQIIWDSYEEALAKCFRHHYDEKPECSCNLESCRCGSITCTGFDGVNTTFWTKTSDLADQNGDGSITGYGDSSCVTDVFMRWKDCSGVCHDGYVSVLDAECGKLKLTQDGTTAIPSSYNWVKLEYWTQSPDFKQRLLFKATNYLAAHEVLLRFGELERATAADLVNAQNVKYVNPERMEKKYKKIMKKISVPKASGVGGGIDPYEGE